MELAITHLRFEGKSRFENQNFDYVTRDLKVCAWFEIRYTGTSLRGELHTCMMRDTVSIRKIR